MTTKEKLDWIASQEVDPKRSEIYGSIAIHDALLRTDDSGPFYLNRYQTVYYDQVAQQIQEILEEAGTHDWYPCDLESYTNIIDQMYEQIQEGYWGFDVDW